MKLYLFALLLATILLIGNTQIELISTVPDISVIGLSNCQYNQASGSCVGFCGLKGQCCVFAFAQRPDGTPLCSCKAQSFCPQCKYDSSSTSIVPCNDAGNICSNSGASKSCCAFQKLTGPIGVHGTYPLCYCQQNSNTCPTCAFNYAKGKCEDSTGVCSGSQCCQFTGIDATGAPSCQCTSKTELCSNCQFSSSGVCVDPTQKCTNGKCCEFKYDLGVKRCECNICTTSIDTCQYNSTLLKCWDPTGKCTGNNCCAYQGVDPATGSPICKCTSDLTTCSNCQLTLQSVGDNSICYTCVDPTNRCVGASCCQLESVSTTARMCICKPCSQPTCKWNTDLKICQDPSGACVGQRCCRPTGKVLANGTPDCYCSNITLQGKCDNCLWENNLCQDPTSSCTGSLCCQQKFFPNSNQFTCRCTTCSSTDNCRYNPDLLKCEDVTGKCSGNSCCSYAGMDSSNNPVCKCTTDFTACSNCQSTLTTPQSCYDPLKKCQSSGAGNCCQLVSLSTTARMCLCKPCSPQPTCKWNPSIKICQDPSGVCVGQRCCRPTGKLLTDGTPDCYCSNITLEGKCDSCMWQNNLCLDPTSSCTEDLCCQQKYFPNSNQFACRCTVCGITNTCRYNPNLFKCQDATGACSGNSCCSYAGVDQASNPICKCTTDLTACSTCQLNTATPTTAPTCYDPSKKCQSSGTTNCCQLASVSPTATMCLCHTCSTTLPPCRWSPNSQRCVDFGGICSTGFCCNPSGQVYPDGTPDCACLKCE